MPESASLAINKKSLCELCTTVYITPVSRVATPSANDLIEVQVLISQWAHLSLTFDLCSPVSVYRDRHAKHITSVSLYPS